MTRIFTFLTLVCLVGCSSPSKYGPPPTDACRQAIRDYYWSGISTNLVFVFKDATPASIDDPKIPNQKIDGWLFEATWDFPPSSGSHFPMASRFLARGDTVILYAPIGGAFQRWDEKP